MFGRNYQVFNIHLYNDVSTFLALKMDEDSSHGVRVEFTHAQTRMFEIATKKNTELFDQLAQIRAIPLSPSANLLESFLYDVMIVDMRLPRDAGEGTVLCYPAVGGGVGMVEPQALAQIVYEDGFVIAGVPVGGERVDLRYKPFIASASMARKNQYLFVNSQVYPDLMSRVSLDILRCDAEGFLSMPDLADDSEVSIAKLSAYIGLALSDGASVAEMREAYAARFPQDTNPADTLKLDERSACVFKDINIQIAFEKMGPYVWKSRQILPRMHRPKEVRTRAAADEDMLLLCGFFRTFIPDERAGYDGYWAQHGPQVVEAWKKAIRALLGASALPEYPQAPLPIPEPRRECDKKDALTSCIAEYAWYWALALAYQRFDHLSIPKDEPDQGGLISKTRPDAVDPDETCAYLAVCAPDAKEIRCALDLALHELKGEGVQARNTLWNIVKQAKNEENPELFECRNAGSDEYAGISGHMTIKGDMPAIGTNARFVQFRLGRARSYAYGACLERPSSEDSRANYSDGVGFCDDAYFDALEKLMLLKSDLSTPRRFDALIIRLPWIKGLICRMDFLKYFKDHAPDGEMTHITDVFGKPRSLYDQDENPQIHMLLSESMFKGAKYFKKLKSKPDDPWKEYWDRVRKTNATLLVAGRNSEPDTHSRLNYQYLCTNGMTTPEMLDLAEEAAKRANALLLDRETQIRYFTQPKQEDTESGDDKPDPENECKEADLSLAAAAAEAPAESGAEEEPEAPAEDGQEEAAPEAPETVEASTQEAASEASDALASADARTVFGEALKRNEELLATRYAKNALLAKARNIVLDAMFGRLRVAGDIRLLTPDLGKLLDEIIRANAPEGGKHAFSPINGFGLGHGCYYAAGEAAPWNRAKDGEIKNKDIVILRNPHYSVGEDAILTPLPEWHRARYDRYFGHLTGIVMLPASAFLTINGADADGDRGNVCCD
ncbi:MAG: hypothetical protein GXX92_12740, partial [Clostridiales bacterium]|nr:hypothetical protein [Clostridiales bacterium]